MSAAVRLFAADKISRCLCAAAILLRRGLFQRRGAEIGTDGLVVDSGGQLAAIGVSKPVHIPGIRHKALFRQHSRTVRLLQHSESLLVPDLQVVGLRQHLCPCW